VLNAVAGRLAQTLNGSFPAIYPGVGNFRSGSRPAAHLWSELSIATHERSFTAEGLVSVAQRSIEVLAKR
jgi:hypothetical protein